MKDRIQAAILNPAGNRTAFVLTPTAPEERPLIAARLMAEPELRIEQVGFSVPPRHGGAVRIEMAGGEFCGNALRSAGYYHALTRGERGKCCVPVEISGSPGVHPVTADMPAGLASAAMPLPEDTECLGRKLPAAYRVRFPGITHIVLETPEPEPVLVERALAAAGGVPAVGVMFLDRAAGKLRPVVCVAEPPTRVAESSCASGSTAAAVVLCTAMRDGTATVSLEQPGGVLAVSVQKQNGRVTALSVCGPVSIERSFELPLREAACAAAQ